MFSTKIAGMPKTAVRVMVILALIVISASLAVASPGTLYMNGGLTTPGGAVVAKGQLWVADNVLGLCRIGTNVAGVQLIIGSSCFAPGTGQPAYDAVNNVIYVGDPGGKTGLYRLTLDAAAQNILLSANVVPATSVRNNTPTGVAVGPDGFVYFGLRADSTIYRVKNPMAADPASIIVEPVGFLQAGRGLNAMAFRGNDLWIADRGFVDHMDNATTCTGGCLAAVVGGTATIPQAITSDGTRYVYIGLGAEVVRYDSTTGTFDIYSTGAIDATGLPVGYGFVWGLGFNPADGTVFVTTDVIGPAGGVRRARGGVGAPPPGTGSIYKLTPPVVGEGLVIDPLTLFPMSTVAPSHPPLVPLTGPAPSYLAGVTEPRGLANIDGHLWVSDRLVGLCRVDVSGGVPSLSGTCAPNTTGFFIPGQPVVTYHNDPITGLPVPFHVFVPDLAQGSQGVVRFDYDAINQALINPITAAPGTNRPSALAIGPDGNVYMGFFNSNFITRIETPDTAPVVGANLGSTLDGGGVRGLAFIGIDLYLAESTNTTVIVGATNPKGIAQATLVGNPKRGQISRLNQPDALALLSDGSDKLYMGIPADVQAFSISLAQQYNFANRGFDGTGDVDFVNVTSMALDTPSNTLYVAEDPFGLGNPQKGHIWAVSLPWNKPLVPAWIDTINITDGSIDLTWHDWATNELGFKVQRQVVPADPTAPLGAWVDVADVPTLNIGGPSTMVWTDTNVTAGTAYNYQVAAYGPSGQSPWTVPPASATVMTLPPAPQGLTANAISDAEVDLSWIDTSFSETGFKVQRALDAAFTNGLVTITAPANATAAQDLTTAGGTTYFYRVIAFNANGDGSPSDAVSVTTPLATQPPTITNPGNQTGAVPNAASLQIVGADYPGGHNVLVYSALGLPTGLSINSATGLISGTYTAGGIFNVTVGVSNGQFTASASFTWTVTAPPQAISVTPNAGVGRTQSFQALFMDPAGFNALTLLQVTINSSASPVNGCEVQYLPATSQLSLMNDAGTGFGPGVTIGTPGTLSNTQCSINVGASSAAGAGQNMTLTIAATLNAVFGGAKNIYMYAESNLGLNSGVKLNGTWMVPGAITVTSPNGGEVWAAGTTQAITWTSVGMTEPVNIALLKAGVGYQTIATNVPVASGSFNWTLPATLSPASDYTVRIMSSTIPTVLDVSNATFSTAVPVTVLTPNGGEVWAAGTTHNITWTSFGVTGNVNVALLKSGVGFQTLATGIPVSAGSFSWTIPTTEPLGGAYAIRVMSATNSAIFDISNAPFTIAAPITVTAPNGGEVWAGGQTHAITWTSLGITGNVNIFLTKAGSNFKTIASNVAVAAGSFSWALPTQSLPAASDYGVRVQSTLNGAIQDVSDAPFTIQAPVTVLSPNGGEIWALGSTHAITWTAPGVAGTVNVALLKANVGFRTIATGVPASPGSFSWVVPTNLPPATDYTIRVMSATDATIIDVSNAPFTIGSPLTVLTPNGGESWLAGSTQTITWNSLGQTSPVNITLLKGGIGFQAIATNVPVAQGSFTWVLPKTLPGAADYTVRVMSSTDTTVFDISNAAFTIVAPVTVLTPNGGEVWKLGSTQTITWTAPGVVGNVSIALLKAGVGFRTITASVPANQGSFSWVVPTNLPIASDYTIRVMSVTDTTILDVSNAPFSTTP